MASSVVSQDGGNGNGYKKFDIVLDHSDHHYTTTDKNGAGIGSTVHKKITQEWKILQNGLPDGIYVRAYETRIDLLRAVIVGPTGTPYHDALFFFDIAFPPDYPAHPPKVHYHSFGLRLNPNLYKNGKVCLSLLNTWTGRKTERWEPRQSTILQVLLSIQALVLNEAPFFNEPGSETFGRASHKASSRAYNEEAFVLSCKTTRSLLRTPPRNFEEFTTDHFRKRASAILRACSAYANGRVLVGYYKDGDDSGGGEAVTKVGKKFKASVLELYPLLFADFGREGASLEGLVHSLEVKKISIKTTPSQPKRNLFQRVFNLLK